MSKKTADYIELICSLPTCKKSFIKLKRLFTFYSKIQTEFYCSKKCQIVARSKKGVKSRQNYEENFWQKVDKTPGFGPTNDCWKWKGWINSVNNYSYIMIDNKPVRAHRFSYEIHNGKISEDLLVRHTCDNRECVNPDHLILGTHQDNMNDAKERNRFLKGEKAHTAKLKEDEVKVIRKYYDDCVFDTYELANMFGVKQSTIQRIIARKKWIGIEYEGSKWTY